MKHFTQKKSILALCMAVFCMSGCNESSPRATCGQGCLIDELCLAPGGINPEYPCQTCDPSRNSTGWSNNDGATCDDGLFCTINDTCNSGQCIGEARDCSDGIACNGAETCDNTAEACLNGEATCEENEFCDLSTDTCVDECSGCVIDRTCIICSEDEYCDYATRTCVVNCVGCTIDRICYLRDQRSPENQCLICDPDQTEASWSTADGQTCDDGIFCNGEDTCSADECSIHHGNPCEDDGLYCTGEESCDEEADRCLSSGDPCAEAGASCFEDEDRCCTPEVSLDCNEDGHVAWFDSCEQPGEVVEECAEEQGRCLDGVCGCEDGFTGEDCSFCLIYVDGSTGSDENTGRSWDQALANLPNALLQAEYYGCEIWVTAGVYYPADEAGDREATFELQPGVEVFGGFAGGEFIRDERDIEANETILSGDIDRNGVIDDGNVYHVVTGANDAIIDGFTITFGHANGEFYAWPSARGAGMYNVGASPTVSNCTFSNNSGRWGGALFNENSAPLITNCTFTQNLADDGGGIYNLNASPIISDCTFTENSVERSGGAIRSYRSSPRITRSTFSQNSSNGSAGAMSDQESSTVVTDSTFTKNSTRTSGGAMSNSASGTSTKRVSVINCVFSGNSARLGGVVRNNSPPTFTNCVFTNNSASEMGGVMYNNADSPTLKNCTLANNSAGRGGALYSTSDRARPELANCILWGNTASEGPQYYNDGATLEITYSNIEGGHTGEGNIDSDPLFEDPDEGDFRLQPDSPCIDTGDTDALPPDSADLDEDDDTDEPIPFDLDGEPRLIDGDGDGTDQVDMGVYEAS